MSAAHPLSIPAPAPWPDTWRRCPTCEGTGFVRVQAPRRYDPRRIRRIPPRETRRYKLLVHILHSHGAESDYLAPYEVTQPGIAQALRCTRPVVSIIARHAIRSGQLEEVLRHVRGWPRRLKTYRITDVGVAWLREVSRP